MSKHIQPIGGMHDVLPDTVHKWQHVETTVRRVLDAYAYREIRLPIMEYTELFCRSIGETTDIVEKEMYTFEDRDGDSLTLRPEATAGMVRAGISNGLLHNQRPTFSLNSLQIGSLGIILAHSKMPQYGNIAIPLASVMLSLLKLISKVSR